jgi:hypothetical protein
MSRLRDRTVGPSSIGCIVTQAAAPPPVRCTVTIREMVRRPGATGMGPVDLLPASTQPPFVHMPTTQLTLVGLVPVTRNTVVT